MGGPAGPEPAHGPGDAGTRVKVVLHDRDASYTAAFDEVFRAAGARIIRAAVQAPRMNPIMERWVGSCRRELLDRTLVWNQRHLMIVLRRVRGRLQHPPAASRPEAGSAATATARRHYGSGSVPGPAARSRRGRDSRISPGGVGCRHPQVKIPPRSPRANAYAERFVLTACACRKPHPRHAPR